ncbi:hypothetical protein Tco_0983932 [Tanacetum coccineum]
MNTFVAHPQANGLVERANKFDGGYKSKAGQRKSMMGRRVTESAIPADIGMPTHRTMMIREDENEDELRLNMGLLQERREAAAIREAKYKAKMEQYYNRRVKLVSFKPGEYVFRRNKANRVEDQGKLGPKWEGPYKAPYVTLLSVLMKFPSKSEEE